MKMEFKGSFLYLRPKWILENDKIVVRKKEYYFSKMKDLKLYIPPNLNMGFSPSISFMYDNDKIRTIIDFSRDEPDFTKALEAYEYIKSNTKEYKEAMQEIIRAEKRKQEIEKQKEEKIKEYNIKKEKKKDKYIKIMLEKPEILKLYIKILEEKNFKNSPILKEYDNEYFKILFWDFLLGETTKSEESDYFDEYNIYQSEFLTKFIKNEKYYKEILKLTSWDEESKLLRSYIYTGKFKTTERDHKGYNFYGTCNYIYKYARIMQYLVNFYDIVDKFESNEELIQIYNNMKNENIDKEDIINKLYLLYKNLYANSFKKKLDKNDIELIVELISRNKILEKNNKPQYNIVSKSQFMQLILEELNELYKDNIGVEDNLKYKMDMNIKLRHDIAEKITDCLKNIKSIDKELKYDIVINIDNIFEEILKQMSKQIQNMKEQKEIENAKKERDRLLKGDFSVELKTKRLREELELSTDKIKNGFEFEEYVANLYKKLGYRIEEVTKKSGDQRSRRNSI